MYVTGALQMRSMMAHGAMPPPEMVAWIATLKSLAPGAAPSETQILDNDFDAGRIANAKISIRTNLGFAKSQLLPQFVLRPFP